MPSPRIEGTYEFPTPILFQQDALGSAIPVTIGGTSGRVLLPRAAPDKIGATGLYHPLLPPTAYRPRFKGEVGSESGAWGHVFSANPVAAAVRLAMVRFEVGDSTRASGDRTGQNVVDAIPGWFREVGLWLEADTAQDLDSEHPLVEVTGGRNGLFLSGVDPATGSFIALGPQGFTIDAERPDAGVGLDCWRRALRFASIKERPPLAWELLISGSRAARRGMGRRAIIEVGTAVEISLEQAIRRRLVKAGPATVVEAIVDQVRTLGARITFGRKLGVSLPKGIEQYVRDPRNAAAHRGKTPGRAVLAEALRIGREVLKLLTPLP